MYTCVCVYIYIYIYAYIHLYTYIRIGIEQFFPKLKEGSKLKEGGWANSKGVRGTLDPKP